MEESATRNCFASSVLSAAVATLGKVLADTEEPETDFDLGVKEILPLVAAGDGKFWAQPSRPDEQLHVPTDTKNSDDPMGASLRVLLQNVAGEVIELDAEPESRVLALKIRINSRWQVPPECQKLCVGTTVMKDTEMLGAYCCSESVVQLSITMVVTLDIVQRCLAASDPGVKLASLRTIAALKGNEAAIDLVSESLEDPDEVVRREAVLTLAMVAGKGDNHAIAAVTNRLQHPHAFVRLTAVEALRKMMDAGDERAIAAVSARLDASSIDDPDAWKDAARWLQLVAEPGDERVIAAVVSRTRHQDAMVRIGAVQALPLVVPHGDPRAITVLARLCHDPARPVRRVAMQTIAYAAEHGDERAIAAVMPYLLDPSEHVKRQAGEALLRIALKGDERAVSVACARLEDANASARKEALDELCRVSEKGDGRAITAVVARTDDSNASVRQAAVSALPCISQRGDDLVVAAVEARLGDAEPCVRRAAVQALPLVAEEGSEGLACAADKVRALSEDPSASVRKEVALLLADAFPKPGVATGQGGSTMVPMRCQSHLEDEERTLQGPQVASACRPPSSRVRIPQALPRHRF